MLNPLLTEAPTRASLSTRPNRVVENVRRSIASVSRWIEFHRQREQLDEIEDDRLADLGLSRTQVRRECAKWPWQP
jgi:uncharacterized protein YjiS (DUF1127 family)